MNHEAQYLILAVGLFLVPRLLQRYRIPTAISCLALGGVLGMGFGLLQDDATIVTFALLGIVALFLFAGLEADFAELRPELRTLVTHTVLQAGLLMIVAFTIARFAHLNWRAAVLFGLAVVTPSAGFILDSLGGWGLSDNQQFWVRSKAIVAELLALVALFITIQVQSPLQFTGSLAVLILMVVALPMLFELFAKRILPHAPKSEFAFLLVLALICASVTKALGVYYLVGAFVVGATAVRLRHQMPVLVEHRLLSAVELFASFFIPFYFFKAGLAIRREDFSGMALPLGLGLTITISPLRVALTMVLRRLLLKEPWRDGFRVGLSLVPTLVFTLVLAQILREQFALASDLYGGLVVFAVLNTLIPAVLLRVAPDYDAPELAKAHGMGAEK